MLLFIDTETTGFLRKGVPLVHPSQPHIVQLAALLTDAKGDVKGSINTIIRPDGWTVPEEAANVHGITTDEATQFGVPIDRAILLLIGMAWKAKTVVAHNIDFDVRIVNCETGRLSLPDPLLTMEPYCTMLHSMEKVGIPGKYGDFKWPKLIEAYRHFFEEEDFDAHDAMADVLACKRIYFALNHLGD